MLEASHLLWHSIMNTYQIGSHDREPVQHVYVHNRYLGKADDVFLVDKGRLPGVMDISMSAEAENPAKSFTITCENKDGLLSPDYYHGKTPGLEAFRGHLDSAWKGQLQTNTKIEIHLGYGKQIVRVLTGLIDSVSINADVQTITITGRSMYKRMMDNTCAPEPNSKFALPHNTTTIQVGLERLFAKAKVAFKGKPIIDEQTNETFILSEPMGIRGESYDTVVKPLINSVFHYLYEKPNGTVFQLETPRYSQETEPVFTVDDEMHLTALEYQYDDTSIYGTVIVQSNKAVNAYSSAYLANKFLNGDRREVVIDYPWANTTFKRKLAALAYITDMLYKVRSVTVTIPANPLLEVYDPIRIQEKISTVSRNYHIRSLDTQFNSSGFTQTLKCSINTGFEAPKAPPLPPSTHLPNLTTDDETITIYIWDSGAVDLDVVTIKNNGKVIQSNIILQAGTTAISITLDKGKDPKNKDPKVKDTKGKNLIEVVGISAGRSGDLTANMYAEDSTGKLLTPPELYMTMPRTNVDKLGFYKGKQPVRRWLITYVPKPKPK